jgi:hypothetical protein
LHNKILSLRHATRSVRKVTSGKLLTKQAMRKKLLYTKSTYILKLLLIVVTARNEAPVVLGNKFLYACVKEMCLELAWPRFDAFRQLLIVVEAE